MLGLAGSFPRLLAPADTSWTRSGSNPLVSAVAAWEETAVEEQQVILDNGVWKMWYTGGWDHPALGYATSADGLSWTPYVANPIYGQGGSGYANATASPFITDEIGGVRYLYISGSSSPTAGIRSTFRVATSVDGIAWTTQSSSISLPSGKTLWGNRVVWKEGVSWKMLQEAGPTRWEIYLYTSSDGLTWSIGNSGNALTTLQQHASGMYGGPAMAQQNGITLPKRNGLYEIWYHAAAVSGNTPTNIYRATSSDLITWTSNAVLTHTGSGDELDQIADPSVIVVGSVAYLYYDAVVNATEVGKIMLATGTAAP